MTRTRSGCPVCGSPDRACGGGGHASSEPIPVDLPGPGHPTRPATVKAAARVNGIDTIFMTTPEEAEARGWTIITDDPADVADEARRSSSARNAKRAPAKTKTQRAAR